MNCPKCETSNSASYSYCINCAEPLDKSQIGEKTQRLIVPPEELSHTMQDSFQRNFTGITLDDKYHLEAELALEVTGTVYLATRLKIGDKVSVKVFDNRKSNAHDNEMFLQDLQVIAKFRHPNAVEIFDYGITQDNVHYVVKESVPGRSLRELISNQGPLSVSVVSEVASQVCGVLDEAHRVGLLHGDIKPDSIIVQEDQNGIQVKVLDIGYAKLWDGASDLTQTGSFAGTPRYMSPEQCQGENITVSSDIYSLGVVLYEGLCGIVPFNAPSPTAVAVQHVTKEPPSMRQINHLIPAEVESVIFRTLAKDPRDRPVSAKAMVRDFNAAIKNRGQSLPDISVPVDTPQSVPTIDLGSTQDHSSPNASITVSSEKVNTTPDFLADQIEKGAKPSFITRPPVLIGILVIGFIFFLGAGGFGLWMLIPSDSRPNSETRSIDPDFRNESESNETDHENENSKTKVSIAIAEDELKKLRIERLDASPSQINEMDAKLITAEKKYTNDYRFTYERAKLFSPKVHGATHHKPFLLLFEAARKAIKANQSDQMLRELTRDGRDEFKRLARGHKEWTTVKHALEENDESHLREDDH